MHDISGMPTVRLRATITIEIEATDYREAAGHQKTLEEQMSAIRMAYPQADLSVRDRRGERRGLPAAPRPVRVHSGAMQSYE